MMTEMTIFHVGYHVIVQCEILLSLILIGRYVYLEPSLKTRRAEYYFAGIYLFAGFLLQGIWGNSEWTVMRIVFLFFCVYVLLTRKRRRLMGCFLFFPVLGMLMILVSLIYVVSYTMTGHFLGVGKGSPSVLDILFWCGMILFYFFGKNFRRQFQIEISRRTLGRWERNFLHGAGMFLLIIGCLMLAVDELGLPEYAARVFTGFGSFAAVLLEVSVIALVQQGNKKGYYQYLNELNERYLRVQLEHFRAYQESERQIRRFRHDMKNHLLCLGNLAEGGKEEAIREYIQELTQKLDQTDTQICCGNEIADAILNEKNHAACQNGISLTVDGRMPQDIGISPTDLCTIFANALDNALEAQTGEQAQKMKEKWIYVQIRHQNGMLNLLFENPIVRGMCRYLPGETSKKDLENHGFGMLNMERAAQNYYGSIKNSLENREGKQIYKLEILLFTTKGEPFTT